MALVMEDLTPHLFPDVRQPIAEDTGRTPAPGADCDARGVLVGARSAARPFWICRFSRVPSTTLGFSTRAARWMRRPPVCSHRHLPNA